MTEQRRLAAIVSADVAGYSRLMGRDESGTLAALKALRREVVDPPIAAHGGRIVKTTGDGLLLEFPSVVDAVRCIIEVQTAMAEKVAAVPEDRRIVFRVGINIGDIIIDGDDIFGDGVNVAARLQEMAPPSGLAVSGRVHEDVEGRLDAVFSDGGVQTLKNIARPIHVWNWTPGSATATSSTSTGLPLPDKPSIAVLPFQNMSSDPEQDYFVDGLVEDIITALSRFKSLFVIARSSSFTYKGKVIDIKQVGRELGVRYVLEGSVRKANNRVRITGQLVESTTGTHIWGDHYDGDLGEIFELQDRVTIDAVGAITPKLEQAEIERTGRKPTESLGAYDCYLRGMASYNFGNNIPEARALFGRAIELDPTYATAHAMAAYCDAMLVTRGLTPDQGLVAKASELACRAEELDRDDANVLARVAWVQAVVVRDLDLAGGLVERALSFNPNLAMAWTVSGWVQMWSGQPDLGIEHFSTAMRLSPLIDLQMGLAWTGAAHAHFMAGRYDKALSIAEKVAQQWQPAAVCRIAAASAALAGHPNRAARFVGLLLDLDPARRVSNLANVLGPYRREDLERYKEGLRLAGLPE
jgi:adenylate cyclase